MLATALSAALQASASQSPSLASLYGETEDTQPSGASVVTQRSSGPSSLPSSLPTRAVSGPSSLPSSSGPTSLPVWPVSSSGSVTTERSPSGPSSLSSSHAASLPPARSVISQQNLDQALQSVLQVSGRIWRSHRAATGVLDYDLLSSYSSGRTRCLKQHKPPVRDRVHLKSGFKLRYVCHQWIMYIIIWCINVNYCTLHTNYIIVMGWWWVVVWLLLGGVSSSETISTWVPACKRFDLADF